MEKQSYYEALTLINSLLKELKRLDDKLVLVEVQLLESRVYHALGNVPKGRAALTSARTSAASVYTPPLLQAGLDMQSGMLHAEDKDFNTAFSYFIEALDGFHLAVGENADLVVLCHIHHFRRQNTRRAVKCGEGLVELRHAAADGGTLFNDVDLVACIRYVERGYENIVQKLIRLGADISLVEVDDE